MNSVSSKLNIRPLDSLPLLSWLLDWDYGAGLLMCGNGVEIRPDGWFEGVWGGSFDQWNFDQSSDVFGSGGKYSENQILLVSPSHPLESLFMMKRGNSILASNSLAFLLTYSNSSLKNDCFNYAELFLSALNGIEHVKFEIETDNEPVTVCSYFNIMITNDGKLSFFPKPQPPPPKDFNEYLDHLRHIIKVTVANARSSRRKYRFDPLTTLSLGYDSPACAVLAVGVGCTEGVTFRTSPTVEGSIQQNDSGMEIGRLLGLNVCEYSRTLPASGPSESVTQFYCDGGFGAELFWQSIATELPQKVLITGLSNTWTKRANPADAFERTDCAGLGLGEFRRNIGFTHVPIPYIMITQIAEIWRIGNSPEMQPWSLGVDYDRPIARRIVEEAGVPRQMFGQIKSGSSFRAWYPDHWPTWFREQFRQRWKQSRKTARESAQYGFKLAQYQILRFSCERRFLKHLSKKMSIFGDGETFMLPVLRMLSLVLRTILKPFGPPHYKIIIRMHPRYTFLLNWANADAAQRYTHITRSADRSEAGGFYESGTKSGERAHESGALRSGAICQPGVVCADPRQPP